MVAPPLDEVNDGPTGIGGWLALLCLVLLVWHPLVLAVSTARSLGSMTFRGLPMGAVVVVQLMVAGTGVAAGLALMGRHHGAVGLAQWALGLSGAMDLFVYSTPFLPNRRLPGTTPLFLGASLAYHLLWMAYLLRSKRVANTFDAGR